MDDADIVTAREERFGPAQIAASKKPPGPAATGFCLYCDEPVMEGDRWCSADHRDAWQKEQTRAANI